MTVPDGGHDLPVRDDPADILGQHLQDLELGVGELHLCPGSPDEAAYKIDLQRPAGQERGRALLLQAMPQGGADARQQFLRAERLGHVIVGTEVKRPNLAGLIAACG